MMTRPSEARDLFSVLPEMEEEKAMCQEGISQMDVHSVRKARLEYGYSVRNVTYLKNASHS